MTPATILRESQSAGLRLSLSPGGKIKATGDRATVTQWLPLIQQHKAGIIGLLTAAEPSTAAYWRVHFADREPVELVCSPAATRTEVLRGYPDAVAAHPFTPIIRQATAPMTAAEEAAVRAWLARIGETAVAEVLARCQRDADAREFFTTVLH
jgi:hypothetical protein